MNSITTNYDFIGVGPFRIDFSATEMIKTASLPVEFIDDGLPEKEEALLVYFKEYDEVVQDREFKIVNVIDDDIDSKL